MGLCSCVMYVHNMTLLAAGYATNNTIIYSTTLSTCLERRLCVIARSGSISSQSWKEWRHSHLHPR